MVFSFNQARTSVSTNSHLARKMLSSFTNTHPLLSFFGLLGLLFLLIVLSNALRQPPAAPETAAAEPVAVQVYSSDQAPVMTFSAKIEKSGVINIYAQSPGIVQALRVTEGDTVKRGTSLVNLSSNYQGGSLPSVSRQIAQQSYDFNLENFDTQKEIISKQKELASKSETQAEELRAINRRSLDETRDLIKLNEDVIGRIDDQIEFLQSTNVAGANDAALLGALQGKAGAQSGLTQLRSGLRTQEYQTADSTTSAQLGQIGRDVALKQLELQEKSLTLTKDISHLNLKLARINESLMYPAAPCAGTVERVYVTVGQSVTPGTLIATIKADQGENTAFVQVTSDVAKRISMTEPSQLTVGTQQIELYPRFVSSEATDGSLHTVLYDIPADFSTLLTNSELLPVKIPVGSKAISLDTVIVPLDAIYQTQDKAFVTTATQNSDGENVAKTMEVTLGQVSGSFVQVLSGLSAQDKVITSRNVQDGDLVAIQ
ncbi:MAG: hypothetical protein M3Q81_01100 [bacterium]|nr:hypothetical protein [bacterium]